MRSKKNARFILPGVKTLGLALASSFLVYSGVGAAGLGKLTVLSSLGQPLRAEIELTSVVKEDLSGLTPKIASFDAFRQANIDYSANLSSLRFAVEERGSRHFVLITSTQSINEPFLDILLELNSANGRLIREYTLLLDPAELKSGNVASRLDNKSDSGKISPVASTSEAITTSSMPQSTPLLGESPDGTKKSRVKSGEGKLAEAPASNKLANSEETAGEGGASYYQVKPGDTLRKIAAQFKHQGISLEQMLVALQRNNSRAFINNNMNLVRSGVILTIPPSAESAPVNQAEARRIVIAQSVDFNAYRNKLADQIEDATADKSVASKKTDGGKITAKVIETPTQANESKDKLKLSKAQLEEQAGKASQEEDKIARQRELDAANARLKELEQNTQKLQKLLELQSKSAAVAAAAPASAPAAAASASSPAVTPAPAATAKVEDAGKNSVTAANVNPAVQAESAPAANALKSAEPASLPALQPQSAASAPAHAVKPKVTATVPAPVPEPGLFDRWMEYIPYGAAILALLGGLGVYLSKRKRPAEQLEEESVLSGSNLKTNSLFGSTGGQSVDTNNSIFNSNFSPSASQLDANEVDPVAEADVYIAYGRDEQAEEILKEALRSQPDRQAVRVKLLEIYAHRKDIRAFETMASELYGMTGGTGAEWAQATSLGVIIDPQNPLYAGGQAAEQGAAGAPLGAPTLPVNNLDADAALEHALSQATLPSSKGHAGTGSGAHSDKVSDGLDFSLDLPDTTIGTNVAEQIVALDAMPQPTNLQKGDNTAGNNIDNNAVLTDKADVTNFSAVNPVEKEVLQDAVAHHETHSATTLSNALSSEFGGELPSGKSTLAQSDTVSLNAAAQDDDKTLNFSPLDFDIPSSSSSSPADPVHQEESVSTPVDSSEFGSLDFDIPTTNQSQSALPEAEMIALPESSPKPLDMPAADIVASAASESGEADKAESASKAAFDFDLSEINFDLPDTTSTTPKSSQGGGRENSLSSAGNVPDGMSAGLGGDGLDSLTTQLEPEAEAGGEMATKLDLAIAYQEIGDKDGARELLEEVLKGGSQEQMARAKQIMHELA